jgi:hypothetical protein
VSSWRLAAVIAVIAAVLGALQISSEASNAVTFGRDQHLAQLNAAVVKLTQNLEDERDLSAAYAAHEGDGPVPVTLTQARTATDAAARTVQADAAGVGAGYQPGTVQDLNSLLASITDLGEIRSAMSSRASLPWPASQVIRVYTGNLIGPANTFSAAVGGGTNDARLQGTITTLAALLAVENEQSVQRATLYAALSAQPPVLTPEDLTSLQQAYSQETADLAAFTASADTTEQQLFANTVAGAAVDQAGAQEILAEHVATANWRRTCQAARAAKDSRHQADRRPPQASMNANTAIDWPDRNTCERGSKLHNDGRRRVPRPPPSAASGSGTASRVAHNWMS